MEDVVARYTRATNSSNLKCDEYHTDVDSLAAVAMSDKDFGNLLFRVKYANDHSSYHRLQEEWRFYVKKKAVIHHWHVHIPDEKIADLALTFWLDDKCKVCAGRGALEVKPQVLSRDPCPCCKGSGKRSLSRADCNGRWKKYVIEMLDTIERLAIQAGGEAITKLARDIETIGIDS